VARISIDVEVLDEVLDQLRLLNEKVDALSNGHCEIEYSDAKAAGVYLSLTKAAVERAWRRGQIESCLTANGLRRSSRQMLNAYAQAKG